MHLKRWLDARCSYCRERSLKDLEIIMATELAQGTAEVNSPIGNCSTKYLSGN